MSKMCPCYECKYTELKCHDSCRKPEGEYNYHDWRKEIDSAAEKRRLGEQYRGYSSKYYRGGSK